MLPYPMTLDIPKPVRFIGYLFTRLLYWVWLIVRHIPAAVFYTLGLAGLLTIIACVTAVMLTLALALAICIAPVQACKQLAKAYREFE